MISVIVCTVDASPSSSFSFVSISSEPVMNGNRREKRIARRGVIVPPEQSPTIEHHTHDPSLEERFIPSLFLARFFSSSDRMFRRINITWKPRHRNRYWLIDNVENKTMTMAVHSSSRAYRDVLDLFSVWEYKRVFFSNPDMSEPSFLLPRFWHLLRRKNLILRFIIENRTIRHDTCGEKKNQPGFIAIDDVMRKNIPLIEIRTNTHTTRIRNDFFLLMEWYP